MKLINGCLCAVLSLVFSGVSAANEDHGKLPNIVFVLCDDLGYGDVQCLNPENGKIPTPAADKLAEQGMVFTDAHSGSSVCTPTRYGLLTGRYSWRTSLQRGVVQGYEPNMITEDRPTVASFLKGLGYNTAILGKWHLNFQYKDPQTGEILTKPSGRGKLPPIGATITDGPLTRGFDRYHGFHHARDMRAVIEDDRVIKHEDEVNMLPRLTRKTVEYINEQAKNPEGQPFFLYVALGSPHTPIVPSPEWQGKSGLGDYGDFVMQTDAALGALMDALKQNGLVENTLVIFSSDNGCSKAANIGNLHEQGHHVSAHYRGSKADLWDGGHRVPFIVRWPEIVEPGTNSDQLICLTDFFATVGELTGRALPNWSAEDSVSFYPALTGQAISERREGVVHHSISGHFGYRTDRWKLLLARGSGGWTAPREKDSTDALPAQLYDMHADPSEQKNLYEEKPEVVEALLNSLQRDVFGGRSTLGPASKNDFHDIELWKSGEPAEQVAQEKADKMCGDASSWTIECNGDWQRNRSSAEGLEFKDGMAVLQGEKAIYRSQVKRFTEKTKAKSILFKQSPVWQNWEPIDPVGPENLRNAPVFLARGDKDYWLFGQYGAYQPAENEKLFVPESATLPGYSVPLKTTPFANQYDAPGGLNEGLGGYHAWQSHDMVNWVHHGPVSEDFSRWATTAEYADGKLYLYYDFPNDQDPHLYIDDNMTDGVPGKNMGLVFRDPTDGSDCGIIRGLDGNFHLFYEDWSPINASKHSWDSPLAGHAVSKDGIHGFAIKEHAIDVTTEPTGEFVEFTHPHWNRDDPGNYPSKVARYEVHKPEQDAFGDWAAISIGGQYYLFGDFHPAGKSKDEMSIAWFTSSTTDGPFDFCSSIGHGHPDPDIGFAEGRFYLINQTKSDYVSPGPWVGTVEARAGVDINNDGKIDQWLNWQVVEESYQRVEGFAKQIECLPAQLDLSSLPSGYGFAFEFRLTDTTANDSMPIMDKVSMSFAQ